MATIWYRRFAAPLASVALLGAGRALLQAGPPARRRGRSPRDAPRDGGRRRVHVDPRGRERIGKGSDDWFADAMLKVVPPGVEVERHREGERRGVDSLVKFVAWCVHLYTAMGLVVAAGIAVLLVRGGPESFHWSFSLMPPGDDHRRDRRHDGPPDQGQEGPAQLRRPASSTT